MKNFNHYKLLPFILIIVFLFININPAFSCIEIESCEGDTVIFTLNGYRTGAIQWQKSPDNQNWENINNETGEELIVIAEEEMCYRAEVIEGTCLPYYSDAYQVIILPDPTVANAGPDQLDVVLSTLLKANTPTSGTGKWKITAGDNAVISDINDPNATFSGTPGTEYTLEWIISTKCDSTADEIVIDFIDLANVTGTLTFIGTSIPLEGANVSIGDSVCISNNLGYYSLGNIPVGNHTLSVTKSGFDAVSQSISIPVNGLEYNIELTSIEHTQTVYGYTYEETETYPLENVAIILINPDGEYSQLGTESDSTGYYQLSYIPQSVREIWFLPRNDDGLVYDTIKITVDVSSSDYEYDCYIDAFPPMLYPLNMVGAQWAYDVTSYKSSASPSTIEGEILVTLVEYNSHEKIGKFKVTGDLDYHTNQNVISEFHIKEISQELQYMNPNSYPNTWYTLMNTSGNSWEHFWTFLGRGSSSGLSMSIKSITGNSVVCSASEDNYGDQYAIEDYEYTYTHTINIETGASYSKWFSYYNDGDPATPGPYSYSHEKVLTGYSIPQDDGTVLDYGSGTSVQLLVSSYSPGVTSGEDGMVIYNRLTPVAVSFSMEMNKDSAEQALTVFSNWDNIDLEGDIVWNDDRSFTWTPPENYPDGYITVTLGTGCKSISGANLSEEFSFYFFMDRDSK
ncbi:carboxypeptidase regulatory-like domain-containing protein [Bacteroidota bacterium]